MQPIYSKLLTTLALLASCFCLPQSNYLPKPKFFNFGLSEPKPNYGPPKPNYGPPKPNYGVPQPNYDSVRCRIEYQTVWETQYVEKIVTVCNPVYLDQCRTEYRRQCAQMPRNQCSEVLERRCSRSISRHCNMEVTPSIEPYTETECSTKYRRDCEYHWEGSGNDKIWVVKAGTCVNSPVEKCVEVAKQAKKEVRREVCVDVPEEKCGYEPLEECHVVKEEVCEEKPYKKCEKVARENCEKVHKKVSVRVSRRVQKKICDDEGVIAAKNPNSRGVVGPK